MLASTTVNSVCSSTAAAAAAGPAAAATGAAADTPNLSSIILTRSTTSITDMPAIASRISSFVAIFKTPNKVWESLYRKRTAYAELALGVGHGLDCTGTLRGGSCQGSEELDDRRPDRAGKTL